MQSASLKPTMMTHHDASMTISLQTLIYRQSPLPSRMPFPTSLGWTSNLAPTVTLKHLTGRCKLKLFIPPLVNFPPGENIWTQGRRVASLVGRSIQPPNKISSKSHARCFLQPLTKSSVSSVYPRFLPCSGMQANGGGVEHKCARCGCHAGKIHITLSVIMLIMGTADDAWCTATNAVMIGLCMLQASAADSLSFKHYLKGLGTSGSHTRNI